LASWSAFDGWTLKDNPLDPEFVKMAGECLNPKQCEFAAKNVVKSIQVVKKTSGGREGAKTAGGRKGKGFARGAGAGEEVAEGEEEGQGCKKSGEEKDDSDDHKLTDGSPNSHSKSSPQKNGQHSPKNKSSSANKPANSCFSVIFSFVKWFVSSVYSW